MTRPLLKTHMPPFVDELVDMADLYCHEGDLVSAAVRLSLAADALRAIASRNRIAEVAS